MDELKNLLIQYQYKQEQQLKELKEKCFELIEEWEDIKQEAIENQFIDKIEEQSANDINL